MKSHFSVIAHLLLGLDRENDIIFPNESNEDICEEERTCERAHQPIHDVLALCLRLQHSLLYGSSLEDVYDKEMFFGICIGSFWV